MKIYPIAGTMLLLTAAILVFWNQDQSQPINTPKVNTQPKKPERTQAQGGIHKSPATKPQEKKSNIGEQFNLSGTPENLQTIFIKGVAAGPETPERSTLLETLSYLRDEKFQTTLSQLFTNLDENIDPEISEKLGEALANSNSTQLTSEIFQAVEDGNEAQKLAADAGIAKLTNPEIIPLLQAISYNQKTTLAQKLKIIQVLQQIPGDQSENTLKQYTQNTNPQLAEAAYQSLDYQRNGTNNQDTDGEPDSNDQ